MTAKLLAATRRGSWDSETVPVDLAISSLGDSKTHDFGGGVLDALISAGRLELISDHKLRVKLASWSQVFDEIRDDEMRNRTLLEMKHIELAHVDLEYEKGMQAMVDILEAIDASLSPA